MTLQAERELTVDEKIVRARRVLALMEEELVKAWTKHPGKFHNAHEGHSVIAEEFDELWDEVKADMAYDQGGLKEAIQTGAMCVRFLVELCDHPKALLASSIRDRIIGRNDHL